MAQKLQEDTVRRKLEHVLLRRFKKWISQLSPPKVSGIFTRAGLVSGVQNSSSIISLQENQVIQ